MSIYKFMCSLQMRSSFFLRALFYVVITSLICLLTRKAGHLFIPTISFAFYSFIHHYAVTAEVYKLRFKYLKTRKAASDAMQEYQVELCFLHTENESSRRRFIIAFLFTFGALLLTMFSIFSNNAIAIYSTILILFHIVFTVFDYLELAMAIKD